MKHNWDYNKLPYDKVRKSKVRAEGVLGERLFKAAMKNRGWEVVKSSDREDIKDHIDFWVVKGDKRHSFDVKSTAYRRCIWLEIQNVQGNDGWLKGKAEYIAFNMIEDGCFATVKREDLLDWWEKNVSDEFVNDRRDAYKKQYNREDNNEIISKVYLEDLQSLPFYAEIPLFSHSRTP